MALLELKGLTKRFGGLVANDRIDMAVEAEEIVGIIGPNGAGKTTLFNCIAGLYPVSEGAIFFRGKDVTRLPPEGRCGEGMGRTFQVVRVFKEMTVLENVTVGAFSKRDRLKAAQEKALDVLRFVGLFEKRGQLAGGLTISDKKRLEFAKALATEPVLLMLDEVLAGLNLSETAEAVKLVKAVRDAGVAVLMVEHVMEAIMPISNRVVVLNYGKKIAEDEPQKVIHDPEVISAYLGAKYHAKGQ